MEKNLVPLDLIPTGCTARIRKLEADGSLRRRMLDLGLITGTEVEVLRESPSGDPTAYGFRGVVVALRSEEASKILVELVQ